MRCSGLAKDKIRTRRMKMRRFWLALAAICFLARCSGPPLELQTEMIRTLWHDYLERLKAGDLEGMMEFFSEQAVLMEPQRPPIEGKKAIREFLKSGLKDFRVKEAQMQSRKLEIAADRAFDWGVYTEKVVAREGDRVFNNDGKYLAVFERDPGYRWRIAIIMVNSNLAPASQGN